MSQRNKDNVTPRICLTRRVGDFCVALMVIFGSLLPLSGDAATLYRWNDVNGNPVMSDRPPPTGTTYTTIDSSRYGGTATRSKPPASSNTAGATATAAASTVSSTRTATAADVLKKDPDLCAQAKDSIFKLETFARIRTTDDDGTVRFLSEQERTDQLNRAQQIAEAYCEAS